MERNAEMIWLMLAGECDMFARALNTVQEVLFTCVVVLWCCGVVPPAWGGRWRSWLRHCAVAGSIPNFNPSLG